MRKTQEQRDEEEFLRMQAKQAQNWQKQITEDEDLEVWINKGARRS